MRYSADMVIHDPHGFLGLHDLIEGQIIRLFRPGSVMVHLEVLGKIVEATAEGDGIFTFKPSQKITSRDYRIYHHSALLSHDPYAFLPTIGEMDLFLFNKGCHYQLYHILGANLGEFQGVQGVRFAVWAPNAESVFLIADFNHFHTTINPMRSMGISGIWELFIPGIQEGEKYKFEIQTKQGYARTKSDPFAFYSELRPATASIVADIKKYEWKDHAWIGKRKDESLDRPILIYELHLGSWENLNGEFPQFKEIAPRLADYCKKMHFTHVELLPIMEHPLDESWGYQVTGFFAVTSRYGSVQDFQYFVDFLHAEGIGVLLDWVPAHFPTDDFSLNRFDGTALYEHEDPRKGMHPHWNTAIFNYGRKEVANFLIASACFWIDCMHIDGLRVDAVASMLYLDYGRKEGEWIPNVDGSNYNMEAIEFLKHLNTIIHERFPNVLMIAEESSSYANVTGSVFSNGLGFDLKWNMGWMNDTLRYFQKDPVYRKFHQNDLTFSLLYAFSERFLSVLSHDEVVHGKGSLLNKMPGPDWQKFANLRLLLSYMICHPGKKLLFMGAEIAQWNEWNSQGEIDWYLLQYPMHQGMQTMVADLNGLVKKHPALWRHDFSWEGYEWVDFSDANQSVISYLRKAEKEVLLCVHHFIPEVHSEYWIHLPNIKTIKPIFCSDDSMYGGSNQKAENIIVQKEGFFIILAPLATMIFEVVFES